jgi:pyruvate-formate lyase-activating enzyme
MTTTDPAPDKGPADDADEAQLLEVRERLLRDATAAGVDAQAVQDSIARAVTGYSDAPVRAFIGVLVEREVRAELSVPAVRDEAV